MSAPTLSLVAGPNGCGKSSLTRTLSFRYLNIIDPDTIARTIAHDRPATAAKRTPRRAALRAGQAHLLETTLAGVGTLRHMELAREAGFRIELHYVCVESRDLALRRIRSRVASGGHDVPEMDALRRYVRSLADLPDPVLLADGVQLHDITITDRPHRSVAVMVGSRCWRSDLLPDWAVAAVDCFSATR